MFDLGSFRCGGPVEHVALDSKCCFLAAAIGGSTPAVQLAQLQTASDALRWGGSHHPP